MIPRVHLLLGMLAALMLLAGCVGAPTLAPTQPVATAPTEPSAAAPSPTPTVAATPSPAPTPVDLGHTNPVYPADFPDPFILRVGDDYYAYATNARGKNLPVIRSSDLLTWEEAGEKGDALPDLPPWAAVLQGLTWAPSVFPRDGGYVLYYVARNTATGQQCISHAVSESPDDPFVDDSEAPWLCQTEQGGSIDPEPFVDDDGTAYLLWKNDGNCCGLPVWLYAQRLSADGRALLGEPARLITYDQPWEHPLVENPSMVRHEGRYILIYSAGNYADRYYAVGYAVCDSPLGPCEKPADRPILSSAGDSVGTGGASFFRDADGDLWIAYHAWTEPVVGYPGGKRSLHLARVRWENGAPVFVRPEAMPR